MHFNDIGTSLFEDLTKELLEWKNSMGVGFSENDIVNIESTLPTKNPFNFIYFGFPTKSESALTTGSTHVQRSTQTYTIDLYSKMAGTGKVMMKATRQAIVELSSFISEFFAKRGFIITTPIPDLNHGGNHMARQPMYVTRTFYDN